jgi:hypothetical protein
MEVNLGFGDQNTASITCLNWHFQRHIPSLNSSDKRGGCVFDSNNAKSNRLQGGTGVEELMS